MNGRRVSKVDAGRIKRAGRAWAGRALRALWPPVCQFCGCGIEAAGRDINDSGDAAVCAPCAQALPHWTGGCRRCALVLPRDVEACGSCIARPPAFDSARAALAYRAPVDRLVQRFKFHGDLAAGRFLATELAAALTDASPLRPELLVPVPLHWTRRWKRGFNQAESLARDLGGALGLDWDPLLERTRRTATQSELPAGRRGGNVRGAFRARRIPQGLAHIALVDDVMTTGATLNECARVLKRAGVARVDVWVVARA